MNWRPLAAFAFFGLLGPLLCALGLTVLFSPAIAREAEASLVILDIVFGAYIIGAPPLAATGLLTAVAARAGRGLATLTLQAAVAGFILGALSAVLWGFLGTEPIADAAGINMPLTLMLGVLAAAAAFILTLLFAGLLRMLRRPPAGAAL